MELSGARNLLEAAGTGDLDGVMQLVDLGVYVEVRDKDGQTPLSNAALGGHLDVVEFLVCTAGADAETRDFDGLTPISNAAYRGHLEIVEFLVCTAGVDIETKNRYGRTPLSRAVIGKHSNVVEFLKEVIVQRQRQAAARVGNLTKSSARR